MYISIRKCTLFNQTYQQQFWKYGYSSPSGSKINFRATSLKKRQNDILDVRDKLMPKIEDWQNRPHGENYPVVYKDATQSSVCHNGHIKAGSICYFNN